MAGALIALLRVIGLIWAVGGVFIMLNARAAGDSEATRWLFTGGALSFAAGLLLLTASPWALGPIALLTLQQAAFHWRRGRAIGSARPRPIQVLAAVAIGVLAVLAYWPTLRG